MPERSRTPLSDRRTPSPHQKRKADEAFRDSRSHRDRDTARDRDRVERNSGRDRNRDIRDSRRDRDRSRSRSHERHRTSRGKALLLGNGPENSQPTDHPSSKPERLHHRSRSRSPVRTRRHSRSRSPVHNGVGKATRTRSPPPPKGPRTDHDRQARRESEMYKERERPGLKRPVKTERRDPDPVQKESRSHVNGDTTMVDGEIDEDALMRRLMGFSMFKSTKNTKVPGNQIYGVRKEKKTEYRQYMNRVGGFNRPLSPTR